MVLGAEIGLAILGLIAIVTGKLTLNKTTVLKGIPARLLGFLCLAPLPIAIMITFVIAIWLAAQGNDPRVIEGADWKLRLWLIEVGSLVSCVALLYFFGNMVAKNEAKMLPESSTRMPVYKKDDGNPYAAP